MSSRAEPTYRGFVETTHDALILINLCLCYRLDYAVERVEPADRDRLIRSGNTFIFCEGDGSIRRWTDGLSWSPSRIVGNFLCYREMESRAPARRGSKAVKQEDDDDGEYGAEDGKTGSSPESSGRRLMAPRSSHDSRSPFHVQERRLLGSLTDDSRFKPGGLVKRTFSVGDIHVISYFRLEDVIPHCGFRTPSSQPELCVFELDPALLDPEHFRAPPLVEYGPDGRPRYAGEGPTAGRTSKTRASRASRSRGKAAGRDEDDDYGHSSSSQSQASLMMIRTVSSDGSDGRSDARAYHDPSLAHRDDTESLASHGRAAIGTLTGSSSSSERRSSSATSLSVDPPPDAFEMELDSSVAPGAHLLHPGQYLPMPYATESYMSRRRPSFNPGPTPHSPLTGSGLVIATGGHSAPNGYSFGTSPAYRQYQPPTPISPTQPDLPLHPRDEAHYAMRSPVSQEGPLPTFNYAGPYHPQQMRPQPAPLPYEEHTPRLGHGHFNSMFEHPSWQSATWPVVTEPTRVPTVAVDQPYDATFDASHPRTLPTRSPARKASDSGLLAGELQNFEEQYIAFEDRRLRVRDV